MDYIRVQPLGRSNQLKVSYFLDYPKYTPHSCMKYKVKRSNNFTFNSVFGVEPFTFDNSTDYKTPPKVDLHSQIDK